MEYGALFERRTKSAFDFSFYDRMYNYYKFWNLIKSHSDRASIIKRCIDSSDQPSWEVFKETYINTSDNIAPIPNSEKTILGEIQIGNWALIYKDIFRLLKAKHSPGANLYIYITDTGNLKDRLSEGIVHFDKAVDEFKNALEIINLPILVFGVDMSTPSNEELKKLFNQLVSHN